MSARRVLGRALPVAAALAAVASACGSDLGRATAFSTVWTDDGGASFARAAARVKGKIAPAGPGVAVAATRKGVVKAVLLDDGSSWSAPAALDARPVVAGALVLLDGAGEVVALDARTGKRVWARKTGGLRLRGAGDDGALTVLSLAAGHGPGSVLLGIGRDGEVVRQVETPADTGTPAVVDGVAFVPWGRQYVSAYDFRRGEELGRVVLRDLVTVARVEDGAIFLGERTFVRVDERTHDASRAGGASRLEPPKKTLPWTAPLGFPGNVAREVDADARDRARLYGRPSGASGAVTWDGQRIYGSYFRIVFGSDGTSGAIAWAKLLPEVVAGGEAVAGGVAICGEGGTVVVAAAETGVEVARRSFGEPIRSCVVHGGDYHAGPGATAADPTLSGRLREALEAKDPQLVTGQLVLLDALAASGEPAAAAILAGLAHSTSAQPVLAEAARTKLAAVSGGGVALRAALERRYDFVRDVLVPPPSGAAAEALLRERDTGAAGLLVDHLLDPATPDGDLRRVARAVAELAGPSELPRLRHFLAMYRAAAEDEDVESACVDVARALVRIDAKGGRAVVERAAKDPLTSEGLRAKLAPLLADASPRDGGAPEAGAARDAGR